MSETLNSHNTLSHSSTINPFEIGHLPNTTEHIIKDLSKSRRLKQFLHLIPIEDPTLSPSEVTDLMVINPGIVNLDKVLHYAADHVIYFEGMGNVQWDKWRQKEFDEAKRLWQWLKEKKYSQAAAFFLQKAKENWKGPENNKDNKADSEWGMQIFDSASISAIPDSIAKQGDKAIKQFLENDEKKQRVVFADTSSAMYLQQASVLARLVKEQ